MKGTEPALAQEAANRRDFLKKARTAAVAAPAVTLLLATDAKPASAGAYMATTTATDP